MNDAHLAGVEARIRASFAQQSMMQTIGGSIVSIAPGRVVLAAPVGAGLRQQQGFAHAGLIFTLGDNAAGYAALSLMPPEAEVMTVELKINLLAPGQGRLEAEGRVLKPGRRLVVVAADVWSLSEDGTRKQVAALQGTMIPVAG
ncbi:MAG: PaaI family thioesterase [Paracoccaceae bacterium]|jgi:uncharacterized protein (TIGR00369 family)